MHHYPAPKPADLSLSPVRTAHRTLTPCVGLTFLLITAPSLAVAEVRVSVVASDDTASETPADNGRFAVHRVGGNPGEPVTVEYVVEGSATPGDDYESLSGRATLEEGASEVSIEVAVPGDDGVFEGDETVTVRLLEDGDDGDDDDDDRVGVVGGTATLTILDSPYSLAASHMRNAGENSGEAGRIGVALGARNESGEPLAVEYAVGGTATAAIDYVALSGIVSIPNGAGSATIDVIPLDDDLPEEEETVEITLTAASDPRVSIGSAATASLSIVGEDPEGDDDANSEVRVSIAVAGDASETPAGNGAFVIRRVGGHPVRPVTVEYSVAGSATPGADYATLPGSVRLEAQESETSLAIEVRGDDELFEGDETVTVTLRENGGDVSVDKGSATLVILDSSHSVSASRISDAAENPATNGQVRVSLGARNESGAALVVEYTTAGSAAPGIDYVPLSGVAVIPTGSNAAVINVIPIDDDAHEGNETVEITLTASGNSRAPVGSPATASVTIVDNDPEDGGDGGGGGGGGGDPGGGAGDDPDGDGLSNTEEETFGTDPDVADSDSDGVNDGDEVSAGSDPLDPRSFADTDGDLVPDAVELSQGTDLNYPGNFADSDGGGTADHVETILFATYGIPAGNAADATDDWRDFDGDGVPDRLEILTGSDPSSGDSPVPNGAGDDSGNGISNAVEVYLATIGISPVDAVTDRDRDGYPDAREVALGLNPLEARDADSDGDGVPNVVEILAGADIDPTTDADGDAVPDAREIAMGMDPLDANSPVANGALDDDGDGASNAVEHTLQLLGAGTNDDTDADGISDVDEIAFGTDPLRDEQPSVWIELRQAGIGPVSALVGDGGAATLSAVVGGHQTGTLHYDWSDSENAILAVSSGGRSSSTLTISPQTLPEGPYQIAVSVQRTVGAYSSAVSSLQFTVRVMADAEPSLVRDRDNDGVPDAFDDADAGSGLGHELQAQSAARMQVAPGLRLRLGTIARVAGKVSARVSAADIAATWGGDGEDDFDYASGIYDFEVTDLAEVGSTAQVVIPQGTAIGDFPEYRKFVRGSGWVDFVSDANNSVASAAGDSGSCPPPEDDRYETGLTPGHWCVRLTIEDGGANDGDAALGPNGVIKDPGGVATPKGEVNVGQGGGSTGPVSLLLLGVLGLAALRRAHRLPGVRLLAPATTGKRPYS